MSLNADQPPIQRLGQYEILEELGRGGFAVVYRAHDTVLKRDVALKILHPALMADPAFVARFENDARAAAQLEHPHIVTIYELGQREGRLYIAMQLLPGGSLAGRIAAGGPLPFADAVHAVGEVAEALDYAHRQGFVHRDVKPTNILFNARGEAVLTDLGLVKAAESSLIARSSAGGIVGTPAYIAPEVWEGNEASPAADMYALGCVLYEMLTGQPLFQGGTPPAVMMAHFQPHRYPEQWPEGVPAEMNGLLERTLARDPAERYAGAKVFAADLHAAAARAADPLAEPYRTLQSALAVEDWPQALRLAQQIAAQDPDYRDVSALAQRAAEAQARAERAQWAAQWRQQALDAEAAGRMDAARAAAQRWLEMAPGDGEGQALLKRLAEPLPKPEREARQPAGRRRAPRWIWAIGGLIVLALVAGLIIGRTGKDGEVTPTPLGSESTPIAALGTPSVTVPPSVTTTPAPPVASSTATSTPATTASSTATPTASATPSATWTPSRTPTRTPTPSRTLTRMSTPSRTATDTPTPTATPKPKPIATTKTRPTATPELSYPAPILVAPEDGFNAGHTSYLNCAVTFLWEYPRSLAQGEAFQVLIWAPDETEHLGAAGFTTENGQLIDPCSVLWYLRRQSPRSAPYWWSVVLVRAGTGERLSPEAAPRLILFGY